MGPVFWSISGVTVRVMDSATEWQINFYRSGALALFVLAVLAFRYRGGTLRAIRATGLAGVLGGVFAGMAMLCNIVALKHTSVANTVLLMASGPIIAAVLARVLLGERVTARTRVAMALAACGIAVMVGGGAAAGSLFGDAVALVGVLFFGAYAVALRWRPHVDMTPAVLYAGLFAATAGAGAASVNGTGLTASGKDIGLCLMLGVVQIGFGSVLFAAAARSVPAVELTLFSLGEPLLAPIWAWVGVGEVPSGPTLVGGAVLLLALVVQATAREE